MHLDASIALAGLVVGFTVGLTGMGGGALMTPVLVLLFRIHPLAAVSSDLVASFLMKPVGAAVHLRRGTVNRSLAGWLVAGSVPTAFLGVVLLRVLGRLRHVDDVVQMALGVALLVAAAAIAAKALMPAWRGAAPAASGRGRRPIRPLPTVGIGALGGLIVGMTSVGSGSLIIVLLFLLYPTLSTAELVGTDLIQAIPLVGSAAAGHLLLGDFRLGLTASLLAGGVPGVYAGARISSRAASSAVRPVIATVLLASGLRLVHAGPVTTALAVVAGVGVLVPAVLLARRKQSGAARPEPAAPVSAEERVLAGRGDPASVEVSAA